MNYCTVHLQNLPNIQRLVVALNHSQPYQANALIHYGVCKKLFVGLLPSNDRELETLRKYGQVTHEFTVWSENVRSDGVLFLNTSYSTALTGFLIHEEFQKKSDMIGWLQKRIGQDNPSIFPGFVAMLRDPKVGILK